MSELTREKIYKKELEKVGAEGNNNLERIRSLAGGGGGSQALDDLLTGQLTNLESNVSGVVLGMLGFGRVTSISLPNATSIGDSAFSGFSPLTSISLPNAISIGDSAFAETSLTSISLPNAISIDIGAFSTCTSLTSISLPNATTIGNGAFSTCTSLTSVSLQNATSIGNDAFIQCTSLTSISLPNATTIGHYAFENCTSLTSLTLGANQVCTIENDTFGSIQNTITVYVPSDLIEQYKVAANWADYYTNNKVDFVAITE